MSGRPEDAIGVALGNSIDTQQYQYRGHVWNAEDIYERMTDSSGSPKKYIVILDREDYQVFELQDNGIYRFYANAGYSFATARSIARAMNEKENVG